MSGWWVYILRCGDGTLYTGMTDDPERRLAAHRSGHGAKILIVRPIKNSLGSYGKAIS